jgi:SAM-dependent methyltransferase
VPPTPFDELSASYHELLRDPLRDRFTGQDSIFFHRRKSDLIRRFFRRRNIPTAGLRHLDLGCGKGELLTLLRGDFAYSAGCDVSADMMRQITGIETRVQTDPLKIPFEDATFDLVTAVCVYHHVDPAARPLLTREIRRVLKPGAIWCMIEHNPLNPMTRWIVGRTPVDAGAVLLGAAESRSVAEGAGFQSIEQDYFLYFPQALYRSCGWLEGWLAKLPLGGQYALFSAGPEKSKEDL